MRNDNFNRKELEENGWIVVDFEKDSNDESANQVAKHKRGATTDVQDALAQAAADEHTADASDTGYLYVIDAAEAIADFRRRAREAEDASAAAVSDEDDQYVIADEVAMADIRRRARETEDESAAAVASDERYLYVISDEEAMADFQRHAQDGGNNRPQLSDEGSQAGQNVFQREKLICDIFPELTPDNYDKASSATSAFSRSNPFYSKPKLPLKITDDKLSPFMLAKLLQQEMPFATMNGQLCLYCAPAFRLYDERQLLAECRRRLGDEVFESYGWRNITDAFKFLPSDPKLPDLSGYTGQNRPLFVFRNGVVTKRPKELRPATKQDVVFAFCDSDYHHERRKEQQGVMDDYLDFLANGDQELVELIWAVIGAVISQDTTFKKAFFFFGLTQTGKSVLGRLLSMLIGEDYLTSIPIGRFTQTFQLSEMQGKLANIMMDDSSNRLQDTSIFKSLTSGGLDSVNASVKYSRDVRLRADTIKLVFGFNTLPELNTKEDLEPFFERIIIIPCMNQVPKDKRDEHLIDKLLAEKDYILFRAMKAFLQVKENKNIFPHSEASEVALQEYKNKYFCSAARTMSIDQCVKDFVDQRCVLNPNMRTHGVNLYEAYRNFAYEWDYPFFNQETISICIKSLFQLEKSKFRLNGPPLHGFIGIGLVELPNDN